MALAARNVSIIALVALAITVIPGGDDAADTVLRALQMAFLAAISFAVYRFHQERQLTIDTMADRSRAILYGAAGVVVLAIAGFDQFTDSWGGAGLLLGIALIGGAIAAAIVTWRNETAYS